MKGLVLLTATAATLGWTVGGLPAAAQTSVNSGNTEVAPQGATAEAPSQYQNGFRCIPGSCQPVPGETSAVPSAQMPSNSPGETLQVGTGGDRIGHPLDVVISSYQTSESSESSDGQAAAPSPDGLTGKDRTVEAGMVVPAVQAGRNYAPPKKPSAPPPDTSKDDCMSCAD